MPVGAAIGVGSAVGGGISALGAKSAAKTQAGAAKDAAAQQLQMYNQTRADLQPYNQYGQGALSPLAQLLGFGGGGGADNAGYIAANPDVAAEFDRLKGLPDGAQWLAQNNIDNANDFGAWHYANAGKGEGRAMAQLTGGSGADIGAMLESLPGYKFARDQGIKSITNGVGSRGQTGAQAKGIARFVTGLADSTYGDQVNRLAAAAGIGQNAAATTGSLGTQASSSIGQSLIGAGTAGAAGTVGAANAASGAIGNVTNYLAANKFMGMYNGGA